MRGWRRRPALQQRRLERPLLLRGAVWTRDGTAYDDGCVLVAADGVVQACGPADQVTAPADAEEVAAAWIGPGITDAHVHLAFADPEHALAHGVVAVRDLGAPPTDAMRWRQLEAPRVQVAGPLLTAPGGYPSRSWGSGGFAAFVDDVEQARWLVHGLAEQVDVVKVALEPKAGPVPEAAVVAAIVATAHAAGRPVSAHALTVAMVERAVDAGVDELAHTPTERLPDELVDRLATAGTTVVSTLQTFVSGGDGRVALDNAAALLAAGVTLRYGTDLGNAGTRPGADPRELRLLADLGLGAEGALHAATEPIAVGAPAGVVALRGDPLVDASRWREPTAVVVGPMLLAAPPRG